MRPLIGYNYGAGEYSRVKKIYRVTLGLTAVIMLIGTLICLAVPDRLTGLFTESEETVRAGEYGSADYQCRICHFRCICHILPALWKVLSKGVPSLVISRASLCCNHHSRGVDSQPADRSVRRLACFLDRGSGDLAAAAFCVPQIGGRRAVKCHSSVILVLPRGMPDRSEVK